MPAFIRGRALRERASADKSPPRDVKKRLCALFTIEFSIGPYPILPRCPTISDEKCRQGQHEFLQLGYPDIDSRSENYIIEM